jgi:hypothetical protein
MVDPGIHTGNELPACRHKIYQTRLITNMTSLTMNAQGRVVMTNISPAATYTVRM